MDFNLNLTPQQVQVVWAGLMELPGKVALETISAVRQQIDQQQEPDKGTAPADPA
jgi:hypothetical protein